MMPQLFRRVFLVTALVLTCAGCSAERIARVPAHVKRGTIVFVPGFKGSLLRRDNGTRPWVTVSEILFGSSTLALPLEAAGIKNDPLYADGLLESVTVVPWLYSFDVYGEFVEQLRARIADEFDVVLFDYDWRLDIRETTKKLGALIEQRKATKSPVVGLIGHSMGGLVVSQFLRFGAASDADIDGEWRELEGIHSVVIAGAPFGGALDMFHDMQTGDESLPNDTLLNAEALSSFPSSYQLLPSSESSPILSDHPIDIFDGGEWWHRRWGLFAGNPALLESALEARLNFTRQQLHKARVFKEQLSKPTTRVSRQQSRLLAIIGTGHATRMRAPWDENESRVDFSRTEFTDGDGVVAASAARPPRAFRDVLETEILETNSPHIALFAEDDTMERLTGFFKGNPKLGCNLK